MVIISGALFLITLGFYEAGKEEKERNVTLENGEKTMYHIPWYIITIAMFCVASWYLILGVKP